MEFHYTNGFLYIGPEFIHKAKIQPTKKEMMDLINELSETVGKEFGALNPIVIVLNKSINFSANLQDDHLSSTILVKNS